MVIVELTVRRHCIHPSKNSIERNGEAEDLIQLTHIIIDCSSFPYIDLMGVDALARAHAEYKAINITVFFACCKGYPSFPTVCKILQRKSLQLFLKNTISPN